MDDLAKDAFRGEDFELAANLYQQSIRELGPSSALFMGLADSYLKGERLTLREALPVYRLAFSRGDVRLDQLGHLITALVKVMTDSGGMVVPNGRNEKKLLFTCEICKSLWRDPVTIPCGHTFCRDCLEEKQVKVCKTCSYASKYDYSSLKCNVVLQNCIEKLFPKELEAVRLKRKAEDLFGKGSCREAATVFVDAIQRDPSDHHIASNCSRAYAAADDFDRALYYAQLAVELQPSWYQGYQCLGNALIGLRLESEAVLAFAKCLALNPTVSVAREALAQCLHRLLSSLAQSSTSLSSIDDQVMTNVQSASDHRAHIDISGILSELQHNSNESSGKMYSEETVNKVKLTLRKELLKAQFSKLPGKYDENLSSIKVYSFCSSDSQTPCLQSEHKLKRSQSDSILYTSNVTKPRQRRLCNNTDIDQTQHSATKQPRLEHKLIDNQMTHPDNLTVEDFKCTLCYRLLYMPLTTPCGHMFCKQCLERSLDHSPNCPLCKSSLIQYIIERVRLVTVVIEQLIEEYFPTESWQRKIQYENELAELARMGQDDQHEIPIFVCILAFPAVSCPLHIFEPRYRLMIRQCIEAGTRQFGMCVCLESNEANFSSYGTMLEIRDVEYLPDGRSLLTTIGRRRFRVLSRGMRDGYHTARVEFLNDIQVPDEEKTAIWGLHNLVRHEAENWFSSLLRIHHMRIVHRFGSFPVLEDDIFAGPNGPTWCWWLIAVLPIDRRTQLMMLAMTSLKDRLLTIRRILASVRESEPH